ncbi:translation initiation factor IF-2 N-terminal domain-containing protein, partial [Cytobacillus sp.]|uniref:translation initiation factor IF-2 N-terminal domain-containing protein n=1 Tax=Cytobacillus sp. TaxID=2675269 RepID=UPI0035134BCB
MSKMRVYEYAKKHNISSKDVITKLKDMNIEVSNHMTTIEPAAVQKLDGIFIKNDSQSQKQSKPQSQQKPQGNQKPASNNSAVNTTAPKSKPQNKPAENRNQGQGSQSGKSFSGNNRGNSNNRNNNNNNRNNNRNNNKNKNNKGKQQQQTHVAPAPKKVKELPSKITFSESLTVAELAKKLHREPSEIIKKLFMLGVMATINQDL